MSIKITVAIAAFNAGSFLKDAIESVLNQKFSDFELIVVDDGSTDNTQKLCKQYSNDPRVIIHRKENEGLGYTRNAGLQLARGKYIHFMDADDWLSTGFLDAYYRNAERYNSDVVAGTHYVVSKNDLARKPIILPQYVGHKTEAFHWKDCPDVLVLPTPVWDNIYRVSFLRENNFSFIKTNSEDIPFRWQTLLSAKRLSILPTPYYYYRMRLGSLTGGLRLASEVFKAVDIGEAFIDAHPDRESILPYFYYRSLLELVYPMYKARHSFLSEPSALTKYFNEIRKRFLTYDRDKLLQLSHYTPKNYINMFDQITNTTDPEEFGTWFRDKLNVKEKPQDWVYEVDDDLVLHIIDLLKESK